MQRLRTDTGFTLIEVLVISPIVILFIGVFIAFAIGLTGESLQLRERNATAYDAQSSLDDIEMNSSRAIQFLSTTGTLQNKQGKNDGTTAFTATNGTSPDSLIFTAVATNSSPYDSTRSLVYNGPGACNTSNPIYSYMTIYFVSSDNSLYKRQVLSTATPCTTPFQKGTCSAATMASSPPAYCAAVDDLLMSNVTGFSVIYYASGVQTSDPTIADKVNVTITSTRTISGKDVTYSANMSVTSANFGASLSQ